MVTTKLGGRRPARLRCELVVSPVRTATRMRGRAEAQLGGDGCDLVERAIEVLGDVDRQCLERRHVDDLGDVADRLPGLVGPVQRVDGHLQKPASVLPEPVGAATVVSTRTR